MRRAVAAFALAPLLAVAAACGGGSDGEATSSSVKGEESSTTTTEPKIGVFDPNSNDSRVPVESTSTTTGVAEGGDPDEFCADYAALEAEFAAQPAYTQKQVDAIRSLAKSVPPTLRDDLEVVALAYESIVGVTLEEMQDPVRQAEAFPAGVTASLTELEAWVDEVC